MLAERLKAGVVAATVMLSVPAGVPGGVTGGGCAPPPPPQPAKPRTMAKASMAGTAFFLLLENPPISKALTTGSAKGSVPGKPAGSNPAVCGALVLMVRTPVESNVPTTGVNGPKLHDAPEGRPEQLI